MSVGVSGTGITSGDYTLSNTTITILNGQTTGSVTFTVVDDAVVEATETATLTISSPSSGITLGTTTTQNIAITDNDVACTNPTAFAVTGGGAYCTGGAGVAVGLDNSETGVTYQLKNSTSNVGIPVLGTGAAISFGNQTAAETYTVEAIRTTGGCKTTMTGSAVVTVNSVPDVATISNQVVCSNTSTTAVTFSGSVTGTVYKWTNNTTSIGLAASGTGDIAAFTAANTGTSPVTATITVTPTYTNGGVTCDGTPKTFTITVNPTPSVNTITDQTLCNATSTAAVTFSGAVTGTVYKWTNNNTSIGLAASGTGNIAAFTGINTTDAAAVSTITVTPYATFGGVECVGAAKTFTITVNPTPRITSIVPIAPQYQGWSNGRIVLTAAGGTDPKTYAWSGPNNRTSTEQNPQNLSTGTYAVTLTDARGCQAFGSVFVPDGVPIISCPQPTSVNINQLGSNGVPLPTVTGQITAVFNFNEITYTDIIYNVNCGIVTSVDGSPVNIGFNSNNAGDVVRIFSRLFKATNSNSFTSYYCNQMIYVSGYQVREIVVPNNYTLQCANSSTETSVTGVPRVGGLALAQGLTYNLIATYTDVRVTNTNGFTIQRTWTLKNSCTGETRTALQTLTFRSDAGTCPTSPAIIAGTIGTEVGAPVKDVVVSANANGIVAASAISPAAGTFNITGLNAGSNYQVRATKTIDTDKKNGVTTLDIALVSKHLLAETELNSAYKIIAADVDKNGEIDATDMLHIRRFILNITANLPAGIVWRFVDKKYAFRNAANPLSEDFPEVVNLSNVPVGTNAANFTAVKLGDVNNSFNATTVRGSRVCAFNAEDRDVVAGNEYTVAIAVENKEAAAFQGTFSFDGAKVKAVKAGSLNNVSDNNFNRAANAVAVSWNGKPEAGATVANITFVATKSGKLSDMLTVNSALTMAEGYDAAGNAMNVTLKFNNGKVVGGEFALFQNIPNPVAASTKIGFNLPTDGQAKLTIYTVGGKVLSVTNSNYKAGYNEVTINKSDLNASGMLYYRLDTQDNSATRKLIIIE